MTDAYFGAHWGAPAIESAAQVPTPVGEACVFCPEPIGDGDQGVMMLDASSGARRPVHRECLIRNVLGTVECYEGTCTCRTNPPDPAAYRTEGRRTIAWFRARGGV